VAEHAKKAIRDDAGAITDERRAALGKELGDVLWYLAQLASELELDLDEIARTNLEKLLSRQRRGVLSGSGDDR
jgi:NTP pyrophosphatase (non-canonical NTP hydrolase)